ncbi:MAG: NAD(P)-dependent malic enzyme [Alphaproteobacteria bacterium]
MENDETPDIDALLAKARKPAEDAMRLHPFYRGKMQTLPKCPVRGLADFAVWYTPGVAAPCAAIFENPELVYAHTNKGNTVAIVSDGSRVLGLGDIGPEAGLPVMEGKALLFKYLGGVDAVPICVKVGNTDDLVRVAAALEPSFGGINLEDIAQPKCFAVLDRLRGQMNIPVWHDDQQGTATVVLAGLRNAAKVVGKDLTGLRIALIGVGAANVAVYRLLRAAGIDAGGIVACDTKGVLGRDRADIEAVGEFFFDKWRICLDSNADGVRGGIAEALRGADVCIAFARPGPGVIRAEWVAAMARDAIVFACANPVPEIWPWEAAAAGARIVATGRGDFPNQVNNSLGFPGIFRGVLDVRARTITESMALAAADALAASAEEAGLAEDRILPSMEDWEVTARIAAATGMAAQEAGVAGCVRGWDDLHDMALATIRGAREATQALMRAGSIPPAPQ